MLLKLNISKKIQLKHRRSHNMSTSINIGIDQAQMKKVGDALKVVLADTYTLYLQTHNFHWNVTGPQFRELHLMFEEHYTELAVAVDDVAERIRTVGEVAPGTYKAFSQLGNIKEVEDVPAAMDMVKILLNSHETLIKTCRDALAIAQDADDESSIGLLSDRLSVHEKTAWMLRATLS